jgi:formylmethanofuran dehydrogenase subunit E
VRAMAKILIICEKCSEWFFLPFKEENLDVRFCKKCEKE